MQSIDQILEEYRSLKLSEVIDFDKFNEYAIVHHSSSIEGSTLTENETRLLLDENLTPKGKPLTHTLMTKDHYDALRYSLNEADASASIPVSVNLIQKINALVMKNTGSVYNTPLGVVDGTKGEFRKGNVSAGNAYFPSYDKVESLTVKLISSINEKANGASTDKDKIELSFAAHFNLVSIHPFYDGNGRTSRLLMNYLQKKFDLPMAIVFKEDKNEYFTALQDARKLNQISPFYAFMYGQYYKFLDLEIEAYKTISQNKGKAKGLSFLF